MIPLFRERLLDHPNHRSSHIHPTPRGGGIVFVFLTCASAFLYLVSSDHSFASAIPLVTAPLALVGLIDDRVDLPAHLRYFAQLFTAFFVVSLSSIVKQFFSSGSLSFFLYLLLFFILLIVVTAIINFVNFMDGIDGLVGGCMSVCIVPFAIYNSFPLPLSVLIGSLLGFLLWNWSPAKVFMGDVGSTFLGALFAGFVLQATSWLEALGFLLVATPLLGDACHCVFRRLIAGQSVFKPHRLHLFQRLHQAGWSHSRVALTYIAATALLSVSMIVGGWPAVTCLAAVELLIGIWLDQRVAVPFLVASQS